MNAGVQAAAGVQFKLTHRLKGFVEITDNFLSVAANSSTYQQQSSNHAGVVTGLETIKTTFIKSNNGNQTGSHTSTTNGGVTTTNYTISQPAIYQHANSTVLNLGVAFAIQ